MAAATLKTGGLTAILAAAALWQGSAAIASPDRAALKSQEAAASLLRGKYGQAIGAYDDALRTSALPPSRQAALYSDRGVAKWRLKQLNEALADFTKAVSLNPEYAPAYNNRGNVYMDAGKAEEALRDFDKAVALSPEFGAAYNNRGNANAALGRLAKAQDDFRKAIAYMPASAISYNGRGKIAEDLGMHYSALRYLNKAIALNGQYGSAYINRARAAFALQRYDDAGEDLDKVIALAPDNAEFYAQRGEANARQNHGLQAFRDFSKAIELSPQNVKALVGRADQNLDRKKTDLALADLELAISLDPKSAPALFERGQARHAAGDIQGSDQDLTAALQLDPMFADAYRLRGGYRDAAGQHDLALADYRRALELDPLSQDSRDAYRTASGETADAVVRPIQAAADGWAIYVAGSGQYTAVNERYPKVLLVLEMQAQGAPEVLEWTPLKDQFAGLGLLRYLAGQTDGVRYENVAIVDMVKSQVVSIEPYLAGERKAGWVWSSTGVTVTDPDGLPSAYELRKPRAEPRVASDDPFESLFGGRQRRQRARPRGIFGWLFN